MKTVVLLFNIALTTLLAVGCVSTHRCTLTGGPPDIIGSWIGYNQDCLLFYRLTFADEGKGVCVAQFVDETPDVYRIKKWELNDDGLGLELVPASDGAERIAMRVVAVDQREMRVQVNGVEHGWNHHALLHREDDVLKRAKLGEQIAQEAKW